MGLGANGRSRLALLADGQETGRHKGRHALFHRHEVIGLTEPARQFVDAAEAFRESVSRKPAAGTLVNLGMTEWRRGRTGAAILAWEQALWVDSFNQPARNNLQFARESTGLDAPPLEWYETASTWLPILVPAR